VLDPLVDRQDRQVAGPSEPTGVVQPVEVDEHVRLAVGDAEDAVEVVGTGQRQLFLGDALAGVREQVVGVFAEQLGDAVDGSGVYGGHDRGSSVRVSTFDSTEFRPRAR
jgi:hypothetical protein